MKFQINLNISTLVGFSLLIVAISACSNDKDIKGDIMMKAKSDINFSGVNYTVNQKVVTLYGSCPTLKSKIDVEKAIKSINVINGLKDSIVIAPVTLNSMFTIKQSADSILASYPGVIADVTTNGLVLKGSADPADVNKLISSIKKLQCPNINNRINQPETINK